MSQMWVPAAVITAVAEGEVAVLTVAVLLPPAPPTSLHDDFTPPGLCRTAPVVAVPAATISFWSFPNTSWYASNWLMSSTFTLKKEEMEYRLHRMHTATYTPYYDKNIITEYKDAGNKWAKWWWLNQPKHTACFILLYRLCITDFEKTYLQKQPFSCHSVTNMGGILRLYTQGGKWTVKNGKSFSEDMGRGMLHQDKVTIHRWREPTSSFPLGNG